jgi:hypothetical protein
MNDAKSRLNESVIGQTASCADRPNERLALLAMMISVHRVSGFLLWKIGSNFRQWLK